MDYPEEIKNLPVYGHLDDICGTLKKSGSHFMVLTADTGAGKSTAIPLALLKHFSGGILMLEPRRLAVLNVAMRVSSLLGENTGETCGYTMHLESKSSEKTRFTVLTEAILTRKIQNDPSLAGISVVVIDEFHERSLAADLALAFLKEIMALRDDLYVIVMSATMDTKKICGYLGENTPCYSVPGKMYPVEISYKQDWSMEKAVMEALKEIHEGSVLAFLPGIREINGVKSALSGLIDEKSVDLEILHSSIPIDQQKKIFRKAQDGKKRIILSSAIAETSVTIPDVAVVIDSGLSRVTEFSPKIGMERLVTKRISLFSANQRTGRAGRTASGKCIRLWSENERLALSQEPEILRTDLSSLVLECAEWGAPDFDSISWLDSPSQGSWESSVETLTMLGCLSDRKITPLGKACLLMGIHPRLACVCLSGIFFNDIKFSTGLATEYLLTGQTNDRIRGLYVENLQKRVQFIKSKYDLSTFFPQLSKDFSTGYALLYGYPDRLAVQDGSNSQRYEFPSGRYASIFDRQNALPKYIVAPDVDAGESEGKIYAYEILETGIAEKFMQDKAQKSVQVSFGSDNSVQKFQLVRYGKIVLKKTNLPVLPEDYVAAVCENVKKEGVRSLPIGRNSDSFLKRVQFYIENESPEKLAQTKIPEKYKNLVDSVDEWLLPFVHSKQDLTEQSVYNALFYYLNGEKIDRDVTKEMILPNGKKRKISYENQNGKIIPVLEIIIQQLFGCFENPKIMGVPVLFKMLSPARRPLQITVDLENFWKNTWPEICSEMKSRYPKHCWDYKKTVED